MRFIPKEPKKEREKHLMCDYVAVLVQFQDYAYFIEDDEDSDWRLLALTPCNQLLTLDVDNKSDYWEDNIEFWLNKHFDIKETEIEYKFFKWLEDVDIQIIEK